MSRGFKVMKNTKSVRNMKVTLKERGKVKKIICLFAALFVLTFIFRWVYEIYFPNNGSIMEFYSRNVMYDSIDSNVYNSVLSTSVNNVASEKVRQKDFTGQEIVIDQKYEKTANIRSNTLNFTNDNQRLRQIISDNGAVIQSENLSGLGGAQRLDMAIGVIPDHFDELVESIRGIGEIRSFSVNKVDKTSEYMNLIAERETLIKTRDSYLAIKEMGGEIQDLLLLEDKILEVEKNLQGIGVNIGIYSTEYSFCTVNFSLSEVVSNRRVISLSFILSCAVISFFWTVCAYAIIVLFTVAALVATVVIVKLYGYIKISMLQNNTEEDEAPSAERKG
jgi:hypothetical protein